MALLSDLFGGNLLSGLTGGSNTDSQNGNSNDSTIVTDDSASVDFSNESYRQEVDEDGSSTTSYDSTEFGTDLDFSNLIQNMSDNFSSSDEDGGLF